jgi:hypothetical protein
MSRNAKAFRSKSPTGSLSERTALAVRYEEPEREGVPLRDSGLTNET